MGSFRDDFWVTFRDGQHENQRTQKKIVLVVVNTAEAPTLIVAMIVTMTVSNNVCSNSRRGGLPLISTLRFSRRNHQSEQPHVGPSYSRCPYAGYRDTS